MKLGLLVLSLLLVSSGQAAPQDDARKALERFQGNWLITTFNGDTVPAEAEAYLVFAGDKYEQWMGNEVTERGSFRVDASTTPMTIDLAIAEGSDAGSTQLGLVQLDAETMALGLAAPGGRTRPGSMAQAEIYATLKKAK